MRIGLVVNDIEREEADYTSTALAHRARLRGHEVHYIVLEAFTYRPNGDIAVITHSVPEDVETASPAEYLAALSEAPREQVWNLQDFDVLLLRSDPAADVEERPWAESIGITFGQMAAHRGILVLNDPFALVSALNKLHFQYYPTEVRPETLISRDVDTIREFIDAHGCDMVLKPLQGSGGKSVFLARQDDRANLNQMIAAVERDGYVVVQPYLPAAREGDVRLLLLEGRPLIRDGRYCAIRRRNASGDVRSNISAGGEVEPVQVDDRMLRLAELIRPKLERDGMFLVGIDIVGDKLLEVNVFSPGGLAMAERLYGVPFTETVIDALERRVAAWKTAGAPSELRPSLH